MKKKINVDELSDYDVIKKCINGEEEYFEVLISRYKNLVYSIVLKMVNDKEEVNDLAQEVFIIDYRRKKKCETVFIDDVVCETATNNSPEVEYIRKEEKINLKRLVGKLPEIYKIPIVLYHQKGLTYQEIADTTNQSLSKVKNRIFRGRKILKNSFLKEYTD